MKLADIQKLVQEVGIPKRPADQDELDRLMRCAGIEPGDFYQELEMTSRFVDTHQDTSFSNVSVSLHSHSFYEILYCRSTSGVEYLVGSARYHLQKGDIILISPGISHRPLLPEHMTEPYRRDVLWLSSEYVTMLSQQNPNPLQDAGFQLLRTAGTRWEYLGDLFRAGVREFEAQEPGWEMAILGNTTNLLVHLYRAMTDKAAAPLKAEKPELLDQVMAYVESHLSEKITMGEVARRFYVSESTISQAFRKKMNVSFYRCVTQRRLISAKALIEQGAPLEAVAERVGFSDYSSFFRAFKQEYGISPRQYKKRQTAQDE